jgi:tripartite-type tricarboxylate transporter receptor subunit TctC
MTEARGERDGSVGRRLSAACVSLFAFALAQDARSEPLADFYRGKTVHVLIGVNVGGGYDQEARLIAQFLGRHIPGNPNVVPENMVGAGGITMANYLYKVAPEDGTYLGMIPNTLIALQAVHGRGVQYDAGKFIWLGTADTSPITLSVWHTHGVSSWNQLKTRPITVAASAKGAITYTFPYLANALIGTKLKIVAGYQGTSEMTMAMERGEIDSVVNSWSSWKSIKPDWVKDRSFDVVLQGEPKSNELSKVPSLNDLVTSTDGKQLIELVLGGDSLGKPMAITPGAPSDRVAALKNAYALTLRDPDFLKSARAARMEINPVFGDVIKSRVTQILATPDAVAEKARDLID